MLSHAAATVPVRAFWAAPTTIALLCETDVAFPRPGILSFRQRTKTGERVVDLVDLPLLQLLVQSLHLLRIQHALLQR